MFGNKNKKHIWVECIEDSNRKEGTTVGAN